MGHLPFAFSVHNFIKSVGSDAGFASIIGLALLVLLYFAHARETAVLRNHAQEAADRIQQLEARVASLAAAQSQVAPAPSRAPAPATAAAAAAGVASAYPPPTQVVPAAGPVHTAAPAGAPLGAPAGVGAPALTAATRLIPAGDRVAPPPEGASGARAPEAYAAAPPAPAGTNGTGEHTLPPQGEHTLPPQSVAGARAAPAPPRSTPRPVGAPGAATTRPPVQIRAGASAARLGTAPQRGGNGRSGSARRFVPAVIAIVALGAVVALLLVLTSGNGGSTQAASSSTPASNAPTTHHNRSSRPKTFNPATVTVTVLNGTATSGLAHRISTKLTAAGFKPGTVAGASDATRTATVVSYYPSHDQDALQVAKLLKLGSASVQRIDASTQAIACPPPSQCAATVVVTVGADLSNQ
jgi:hypothetical protein